MVSLHDDSKMTEMNLSPKQKQTHIEKRLVVVGGAGGEMGWEFEISRYKLLAHRIDKQQGPTVIVVWPCPTLGDPVDCSTPDFPDLRCLPEFAQTHVHRVSDVLSLSHPLSHPTPSVLSLSWNHGIFR